MTTTTDRCSTCNRLRNLHVDMDHDFATVAELRAAYDASHATQADRNKALSALLASNVDLTTLRGGPVRASTQRRGDAVTVALGYTLRDGSHVVLRARNLKRGWKIDVAAGLDRDRDVMFLAEFIFELARAAA